MTSVLDRASSKNLFLTPFPHLVVPDALPPDDYQLLAEHFPPTDEFAARDDQGSNKRLDLLPHQALGHPTLPDFWKDFVKTHTSPQFLEQWLSFFEKPLKEHHPKLFQEIPDLRKASLGTLGSQTTQEVDLVNNASLSINSPVKFSSPTVRTPHVDNYHKIFGGLLYFRDPRDQSKGGDLNLYRFRGKRVFHGKSASKWHIESFKEVPYSSNVLVIFMNTIDSLHGVTPRSVTPFPRRFVYFSLESRVKLFDVSQYQAGGLANLLIRATSKKDRIKEKILSRIHSTLPKPEQHY